MCEELTTCSATSLLKFLNMQSRISLGRIPSHAGIDCNEQADALAKEVLKDSPISAKGQISLPACKKLVAKHTKRLWQQRCDRFKISIRQLL